MKYPISVVLGGTNFSMQTGLTSEANHCVIVSVKLCPSSLKFHRCRAPCQYLSLNCPLPRLSGLPGVALLGFILASSPPPTTIHKSYPTKSTQIVNQDVISTSILERFLNDCRKTKTKAVTPTNHNRNEKRDEPITIPSNHL